MTWTERIANLGASPDDTDEERAHKTTAVLITVITAPLVLVWSSVYGLLGQPISAAIPIFYGVVSIAGLVVVARTNRVGFLRMSQLGMWLVLPFLLQWSLGGFANGSAVALWAMGAPLMAHTLGGRARPWLIGFSVLAVFSGLIDSTLAASAPDIPDGVITAFFGLNFLAVAVITFVSLRFFISEQEQSKQALEAERQESERLLLNILPADIAARLKAGEEPIADRIPQVTVVVADIVGFTPMSEKVEAVDVVDVLNDLFSRFDDLTEEHGLAKLKTIGDAYQAVGGLPGSNADQVASAADLALAMQAEVGDHAFPGFDGLRMRIGINTGPVVAGIIGKRKFSYDLWGDTINTASRMESHGVPGQIQVTDTVYEELRDRFDFTPRGAMEIKGKGEMLTYLLEGRLPNSGSRLEQPDASTAGI
jgi:guanylate cyclase